LTVAEKWASKYLGYEFATPSLLQRALTHKSRSSSNNERLEFLGDALLGFVVAEALYSQEQLADEGALSRLRASLVRGDTLADLATELQLGDAILLGSGEYRTGGQQRRSILADSLEAVLGAILLDADYATARRIILRLFADRLASLPDVENLKDSKTLLQERLQAESLAVPVYTIVSETGPAHARVFEVRCYIEAMGIETVGRGHSRRIAEQVAAANALATLGAQL
jgi:ribonuclease III